MTILNKIVAQKKIEVERNKQLYPLALLQSTQFYSSPAISLSSYILREDKSGIIAEIKRQSPSQPQINLYADVESVSIAYMQSGASALSILTDQPFFGGTNNDLTTARVYNYCPILRKDFIIDPYQVHEARSIGADAILLIAAILTKEEILALSQIAQSLQMEVVLEVHDEDDISKYSDNVDIIGVNNRDLKTFQTSIENSVRLSPLLPTDKIKISESGIHSGEQIVKLRAHGYDGFLIGEQFMKTADPAKALRSLISQIHALTLTT